MQKIIIISGKKQSGKSSLRNYIMGRKIVDSGKSWDRFNISTTGELMVPTGKQYLEVLDLNNNHPEFSTYAQQFIWPYAKNYSIANSLKYIAINMFGVEYSQCFGSDEDKNKPTNIRWSDIKFALPPRSIGKLREDFKLEEFMTGREFLENFGKMCRMVKETCFVDNCINEITFEAYPLVVVDDIRYPDELTSFYDLEKDNEVEIFSIRLLRDEFKSKSEPETALDDYPIDVWNVVVPEDATIVEKNELIAEALINRGWL